MDNLEFYLNRYINRTVVWPDGTVLEIKEFLGNIRNLKIEMYPNDHNPPHFHVKTKCETINAKFKLEDCSLISGRINKKDYKRIQAFYEKMHDELWKYWNEKVTRK